MVMHMLRYAKLFGRRFPHYRQLDGKDCGPTCLRMIAAYYGKKIGLEKLRNATSMTKRGVSMRGIADAAESIGFKTLGVRLTLRQLFENMPLPCILHWNQRHFVVCYDITCHKEQYIYHIADPGSECLKYTESEMRRSWIATSLGGNEYGTALALEPTSDFHASRDSSFSYSRSLAFISRYLRPYYKELAVMIAAMIVGSVLQLMFPFLAQALVDIGVGSRNIDLIVLILIAQLAVYASQTGSEFVRSWMLLHINARINLSLVSDFLAKLMRLPMSYFDTRNIGDIMQRISDHDRIELFLTGSSVNTLFSIVNFIIYASILFIYNPVLLAVFIVGNSCYIVWVAAFMKYRRELDIKRFEQSARDRSNTIQLITGMQEIKLNNCENRKRWQWERIQVNILKIRIIEQTLGQIQQIGSIFFNQATTVVISYLAARGVVDGTMSLGMMVSITYIIGTLNGPVNSFIGFIRQLQDAGLSLERLNEIHQHPDEFVSSHSTEASENNPTGDIVFTNVSFGYDGTERNIIIPDMNLTVPFGKVTAIVGDSGSGKTTLMKLMLGFYPPVKGSISIGGIPLCDIRLQQWRGCCGAVMQDGFIFSDTILHNIAIDNDTADLQRARLAAKTANIDLFIESLPLGYDTVIGMEGNGISQGQRQRILLARVIYQNPDYIFLDEATNSLDANNEHNIMNNLQQFCNGKTVVVIAHRLSTVRDADNIIVLENGTIAEEGTHDELIERRGMYYTLVKNQIDC